MTRPAEAPAESHALNVRRTLVAAAVIAVVIEHLVPFGGLILYPFTLLATWVHEMGHGVTALLVGGSFASLDVFADASGLAHTSSSPGIPRALVAIGGLLAPPFVGSAMLGLGRGPRRARIILLGLALALLVSLALWVRTAVGWIAMPLVAALVAAFAVWGSANERLIFAQFIGLLLGLDTVARIDYLFMSSVVVDGDSRPSDVANVVGQMGSVIPAWGALLALVGLSALYLGLKVAWRRPPGDTPRHPPRAVSGERTPPRR
jgi:hypothetical protein